MRISFKKLIFITIVLLAGLIYLFKTSKFDAQIKETPLIPVADFFKNPEIVNFQLSPDGQNIAFLSPWKNRLNIFVREINSTESKRITNFHQRNIASYIWVNNNQLAYIQDKDGDENYHLYLTDKDGANFKDLTPFEGVRVSILDSLIEAGIENEILIKMNKEDRRFFDVYKVNLETGELTLIQKNPGNVDRWMTDHDGNVRIAIESDGVNNTILYKKDINSDWVKIKTTNFENTFNPILFTPDNKSLYVASNLGRDKLALIEYNPETNEETLIYENHEVDIHNVIYSRKKKKLTGVLYIKEKTHIHFLDDERQEMQIWLENHLQNENVAVLHTNLNEDKYIVAIYSDKIPSIYYFFDKDTQKVHEIANAYPWLKAEELSEMLPFSIESRDGLTLHGYVAFPLNSTQRNLPFVLIVHGGPWTRDDWGYDSQVQFLANRGYGVAQVNFRGSTGYGREFWKKGFLEWGKNMQNDLTDTVNWLIKKGYADPKKIAIMGGSYGGYATLAGLTFTPDVYAAGIDIVGPSNLFTLLETIPPYWEPFREKMYLMVGNPETQPELLKNASPYFFANKIQKPLLIVQGCNDPRVKQQESDQIVEELEKHGIPYQYILKPNEGHGFHNEENAIELYACIEEFLHQHIGGKTSGIAKDYPVIINKCPIPNKEN